MTPLRLKIEEFRVAKGMTQADLAEKAGVRRATISDMENGKSLRVDLPVLERIADALGVMPTALIESVPSEKPKRK